MLCPTGFIPPLTHNLFRVEDWLLNVSSHSFECIFLFYLLTKTQNKCPDCIQLLRRK